MFVLVQKIPPEVSKNRLKLYFANPKRGGKLTIESFNEDSGEAIIDFVEPTVAENVIGVKEFQFKNGITFIVSPVDQSSLRSLEDKERSCGAELQKLSSSYTKAPKPTPRAHKLRNSSICLTDEDNTSPSVTAKTPEEFASSLPNDQSSSLLRNPVTRESKTEPKPRPRNEVQSRFLSQEKSDEEVQSREPVIPPKGKRISIPEGLQGQDLVGKLGQKRMSKTLSAYEPDEQEEDAKDQKETVPVMKPIMPMDVMSQLKGKLQQRKSLVPQEDRDDSDDDKEADSGQDTGSEDDM